MLFQVPDYNNSTPAAPTGTQNGHWQKGSQSGTDSLGNPIFPLSMNVPATGGENAQTGTSYTLQQSDRGKLVTLSNSSAIAVTLPVTSPATIDSLFVCAVENLGAGTATLAYGSPLVTVATLTTGQGAWLFFSGTNWRAVISGGGFTSPLTTKGDIYTRGASADARIGVGADGQVLTADSTQTNGIKWATAASGVNILTGSSNPWLIGTPQTVTRIQGTNTGTQSSVTSLSLAYGSNVTAGNLLVVAFQRYTPGDAGGTTPTSITDSVGTTYSLMCNFNTGGTTTGVAVWAGIAGGSGANTVSVNGLPAGTYNVLIISEYNNAQAILDVAAVTTYGSSSPVASSITTVQPGDVIYVSQVGSHNACTFSIAGSFTLDQQKNNADALMEAHLVQATAATVSVSVFVPRILRAASMPSAPSSPRARWTSRRRSFCAGSSVLRRPMSASEMRAAFKSLR